MMAWLLAFRRKQAESRMLLARLHCGVGQPLAMGALGNLAWATACQTLSCPQRAGLVNAALFAMFLQSWAKVLQ